MTVNVLLEDIAGLGAESFGPDQPMFSSCAVSPDGKLAYFGRYASYDPEMRNLVVASLDNSGNVVGIPQCYRTSTEPLAPIIGYPPTGLAPNTNITAVLVNSAKSRLYMAEDRGGASTARLNVYTLAADGNPDGVVRTYADGNTWYNGTIWGLVMHPKLPLLYMVGAEMLGVVVQRLDSSGEPILGEQTYFPLGVDKYSIAISTDGRYLYGGTSPDILEVISLDSNGNPTELLFSSPVSNLNVGTVEKYLQFAMGAHAIYMVRPNPSGPSGLPILALWPLDSATGLPIGSAEARPDINPPLLGASAMTIAVDNNNSLLWVANLTTFADAFTGATIVSGITPTSYVINGDGTLGVGTPGASFSQLSNAAVLVASGSGRPLLFNRSSQTVGNLVKGYQCRITVTAANGGSFPLTMNGAAYYSDSNTWQEISFGTLSALNTPSAWVELDSLLQNQIQQIPIVVGCGSPLASMAIQFDLADSSGSILKSVTESVLSIGSAAWAQFHIQAGFLVPGYCMSASALTGTVTGLETYSERTAEYLGIANLNPVAAADRPKLIVTDCYSILGGEANNTVLTNLAQAMQALGFNTVNAYRFDGLGPANINNILNANGLPNRTNGSNLGTYGNYSHGGNFSFDTLGGITKTNLHDWAELLVSQVASANGGSRSQIVAIEMADEPGWPYPLWLDIVNGTAAYPNTTSPAPPSYLAAFQEYLHRQASTHGFTYTDLGGSSWSSLRPIGQNVGNPLTGGPASLENRMLYYWTMRFYTDSAVEAMKMGQEAVTAAVGHPVATPVNWNNWIDQWYLANPTASAPDSAMGYMDWMLAGRTSAHTAWTEDWFNDTKANNWSVMAAAMRSSTQAGTQGFGGYVVGPSMSQMPTGGKYKVFPLLGSGAKIYTGYAFGPAYLDNTTNCWSDDSSALVNGISRGNVYSEYADANRLIGRSESILYPGVAERSTVAILLPSASSLWDTQYEQTYYALELHGLYYAISHGYNVTVDLVDDAAIERGALTNNDYFVLYVTGPNVSAKAQAAITDWIETWGPHNRQLVLVAGAGVADEYNTATAGFDKLAGLVAGRRSANRDPAGGNAYEDPYTATVQDINTAFYFNGQKMNIRGPFQALAPLSGPAGPSWTDQVYTTSTPANQPACMTKVYAGSGVSNFVTTFGFFPGYQYYASPNTSYTNFLPQGWSIMAREIAMMPVIRQNPPRTVRIYNGKGPAGETLTEDKEYLTTCPVEALRVNVFGVGAPTAIAVVLLNWGGTLFSDLKFKVLGGIASPTIFSLASGEPLSGTSSSGGINSATMTLNDVDVVLISK